MFLAAVAADQGNADEAVMSEGGKVSEQLASEISELSCRNGKIVMPSGRRPSPRSNPSDSSTECEQAASRARILMLFMAE